MQLEVASPFHILNIKVRPLNMLGKKRVGEVAFPFHITLRSQTSEHVGKEEGGSLQLEVASPFHILNILKSDL